METTKENLIKAVISVMKEVKGMEKNSRVGTGNSAYNGTKDQDVKEVFNEALAKYGLCMLPTGIKPNVKIERWQETDNYGTKTKQLVFTEVETEYTLLHESGEFIILKGYGHGVDSQDKSAGKATTYALKNCLLYSFMTPVGKIDDTDTTHSDEHSTPKPAPKKVEPTKPAAAELPYLNANSPQFASIVQHLKDGGSIDDVKKFRISPEVEKELLLEASK